MYEDGKELNVKSDSRVEYELLLSSFVFSFKYEYSKRFSLDERTYHKLCEEL